MIAFSSILFVQNSLSQALDPSTLTPQQLDSFFGRTTLPSWYDSTVTANSLIRSLYGITNIQQTIPRESGQTSLGPYLGFGVRAQCGTSFNAAHNGFQYKPINNPNTQIISSGLLNAATAACGITFARNDLLDGLQGFLPQGRAYIQSRNIASVINFRIRDGITESFSPPEPAISIGYSDNGIHQSNPELDHLLIDEFVDFYKENKILLYSETLTTFQANDRDAVTLYQHATSDRDLLEIYKSGDTFKQINSERDPQASIKNALVAGLVCHNGTMDYSDDNSCSVTENCISIPPETETETETDAPPPPPICFPVNRFGSFGPSPEGRVKPDLVLAHTLYLTLSSANSNRLLRLDGSTGAAHQLMGLAGSVIEMFADGLFTGDPGRLGDLSQLSENQAAAAIYTHRPSPEMSRALLVNSAYRYPVAQINRNHQGWGIPRLNELLQRAIANNFRFPVILDRQRLTDQQTMRTFISVDASEATNQLLVTMAFNDAETSATSRANDISLKVTSPSNVVYWGNSGLLNGDVSTAGGTEDTINTIENVVINNPEMGRWVIETIGSSIRYDNVKATHAIDSNFALIATCSSKTSDICSSLPTNLTLQAVSQGGSGAVSPASLIIFLLMTLLISNKNRLHKLRAVLPSTKSQPV
ncbi:hypothetical protein [Pelagibaculum spongiae]|uniref:hypothetical protein n=1 Tax=Pelagibaculum spongiae TaxID=2080658 RepID=UPI0010576D13|nr:hypothetical protein [Pelagibaculum spongiae]